MAGYLVRRLAGLILVLFGISLAVFLIMHLRPGDPALIMLGPRATEESLTRLRHDMGLDLPLYVQYVRWLGSILHGDLGRSIQLKRAIGPLLTMRFQATAWLTLVGAFLAVGLGVPAGILSATRQYSLLDRSSMVGILVGFSVPVFWFGLLLQLSLGQGLGLPISGMHSPGDTSLGDMLLHAIMPALALAVGPGAVIARMTRSSMLEVIRQDYIRTARAKGLAERVIIYKHALKNAMIPVVTVMALEIPGFFTGAVITETIFAWPGMGRLYYDSVMSRDYTVLMAILTIGAALVVVFNLIADIAYAFFDPRIKYD